MSKLDELMDKIQLDYVSDEPKVKQYIKDYVLEVIGGNEPLSNKINGGNKPNYKQIMARNRLRKQLRDEVINS